MIACRWCIRPCTVVLDLGEQPAADHFPLPTDPLPDPVYPLRMALCPGCGLAQLAEDATVPDEPRGIEPAALRAQAEHAVTAVALSGCLPPNGTVREFGSPHGGSWEVPLRSCGLEPITGAADVVVDVFGMMHEADQRAGMAERVVAVLPGGVLLMQFHSLAAIVAQGSWNALRHGHFAYYSVPALLGMAGELGWVAVAAWEFDLYGGTVLLAFRRDGAQTPEVTALAERERAAGVVDAAWVATLGAVASSTALREFLEHERAEGRAVLGYGAASRSVALLQRARVGPELLAAVADASAPKQGRTLPGSRVPVISPGALVEAAPDRVVLFVGDLLAEVRRTIPDVEARGGAWVVLEPELRVVPSDAAQGNRSR